MQTRLSCKRKNGLSLVEVTIAIGMLSVILGIVIGISSQGYRYLRKARMQTIGMFLIQEGMEDAFEPGPTGQARAAVTGLTSDLDFFRTVSVLANPLVYPVPYDVKLDRIRVRVDWQSAGEEFILQTYKADY